MRNFQSGLITGWVLLCMSVMTPSLLPSTVRAATTAISYKLSNDDRSRLGDIALYVEVDAVPHIIAPGGIALTVNGRIQNEPGIAAAIERYETRSTASITTADTVFRRLFPNDSHWTDVVGDAIDAVKSKRPNVRIAKRLTSPELPSTAGMPVLWIELSNAGCDDTVVMTLVLILYRADKDVMYFHRDYSSSWRVRDGHVEGDYAANCEAFVRRTITKDWKYIVK